MQGISLFCSDRFSDPHKYVRCTLHCQQTGYEAGSCVLYFIKTKDVVSGLKCGEIFGL